MAQGRKLQTATSNMRGMIWDMRLTNDSTSTGPDEAAAFELAPESPQTLVFTFATDRVSSNDLLFEIARHNFRSFVVKDFDLEQMNFGRLGMIIVHGFENMEELNHYRGVMGASSEFRLPAGVRPVVISEANLKIMLEQGRSFDEYFRYLEEQNYVDAQAGLIPVEDIETLEEADRAAEEAEAAPETSSEAIAVPETPGVTQETPAEAPEAQAPQATTAPPAAPAQKPAPAPAPAPAKPTPAPLLPGSEGDDPLLED